MEAQKFNFKNQESSLPQESYNKNYCIDERQQSYYYHRPQLTYYYSTYYPYYYPYYYPSYVSYHPYHPFSHYSSPYGYGGSSGISHREDSDRGFDERRFEEYDGEYPWDFD